MPNMSLLIVSVEPDFVRQLDFDDLVNDFTRRKVRKVLIPGGLQKTYVQGP